MVNDYRMTEAIENLSDLITDEGDGRAFFARNYITQGMEALFREGLLRLAGRSDQAAFELAQAMGGGKTHLMTALGLLAKHPHLRAELLPPELAERLDFGPARIAAFNGRNDPDHYVWGEIAEQLGPNGIQAELMRPYWIDGPRGVDEAKWLEIIGDEPTLILLDELPPYLLNATTRAVGKGSLADVVTYSLSNLLTAAIKLPRCCVVIANLSGSYDAQTKDLARVMSNLQQESSRQAMTITPVQLAGNEIYQILKKRLFTALPDDTLVDAVAEAFAEQVKAAEDGGYITARAMEAVADEVRETYPFHPSFKNLVALFKENEGFRQTRGLMQFTARLLRSVWNRDANDCFLIGTQHLDLNDVEVRDEIQRVNSALLPAVVNDIADHGNARAEEIDGDLGSDAATQVAKLVLSASLSRAVGAHSGLTQAEIIEYLVAPFRKPDEFLSGLERLRDRAWYLHREGELFYFKETENLGRRIERDAKQIPAPKLEQALINRLTGLFSAQSRSRAAYQEVQIMPRLDDVKLSGARILLVVQPDGRTPPEQIRNFFAFQQEKNNVLILSGNDSHLANEVEARLRELYAIERIHHNLKPGDTLFDEARDKLEELEERFTKAVSGAYNRLFLPGPGGDGDGELVMATIDNGLRFGDGEYAAEAQIERLLASGRCDNKLALDIMDELPAYWAMAETYLWPASDRRVPWRDLVMRAKTDPTWPWLPGARGLEVLRDEALKQGRWRQTPEGQIEKGPFPAEQTSVNVTVLNTNRDTGETTLSLTPRHAGDSPSVYVLKTNAVSEQDEQVQELDDYRTTEATLYFIAVDSTGRYETGPPTRWTADLTIRHEIHNVADSRKVELRCTPPAELRFTLDGTNARAGQPYSEPFAVPAKGCTILIAAKAGEVEKAAKIQVPADGDDRLIIDDNKPARIPEGKRVNIDTTDKAFGVIQRFRDRQDILLRGVQILIGDGESAVQIRFNDRALTAAAIETAIRGMREAIGDEQAGVQVTIKGGVSFGDGFALKQFAELVGLGLSAGDVVQE
ncbi:MAG: ATP-binding protein [Chromatiaceae bacterium]|nr:MAG: ATP-binding protein [Chromatiaceae bacterium]